MRTAGTTSIRTLQLSFERMRKINYARPETLSLVREVVAGRKDSALRLIQQNDRFNAAFELSYAAKCAEMYAKYFLDPREESKKCPLLTLPFTGMLKDAVGLRREAAALFRTEPGSRVQLAYELSYLSNTMNFIRKIRLEEPSKEQLGEIIKLKEEAVTIFRERSRKKDLYFEHMHLSKLHYVNGRTDPASFVKAADHSINAASVAAKARVPLYNIPDLYRLAAASYRRLAALVDDPEQAEQYRELSREMDGKQQAAERLADETYG